MKYFLSFVAYGIGALTIVSLLIMELMAITAAVTKTSSNLHHARHAQSAGSINLAARTRPAAASADHHETYPRKFVGNVQL